MQDKPCKDFSMLTSRLRIFSEDSILFIDTMLAYLGDFQARCHTFISI